MVDGESQRATPEHPKVNGFRMSGEISKQQEVALARAQQISDTEADRLVRDNIGWMLVLAERLLRDRGLAEDAVQEAFMAALRGLDRFEGRSSLKTWLHRVTVNASLTKLRQSKRRAEQQIDEFLPEFDRYECREANVKVRLHRARAALKKLHEPILRSEVDS